MSSVPGQNNSSLKRVLRGWRKMVINQRIGLAMAEQADRVNSGRSAQQKLDDAREEIRTLKQRLEISEAKAQEYRQRAELAEAQPTVIRGIVGSHGSLTTPAEFAESHHTSVSTVNRALNNAELM